MRHSLLGGLVLAMMVGCASTPSPSATDDKLTLAKFNYLQQGMSLVECNRVMGSQGVPRGQYGWGGGLLYSGGESTTYTWGDYPTRYIMASIINGEMRAKSQIGLP